MATHLEVHEALADAVGTISGLRMFDYVPEQVVNRTVVLLHTGTDYHAAMGNGLVLMSFDVVLFLERQSARASQQALRDFIDVTGAYSIKAAIEADRTLGLTNTDAVVDSVDQPSYEDVSAAQWLTVRFSVRVHTR